MKVVIAGGTGFIGRSLQAELTHAGHEFVLLSRRSGEGMVQWDGQTLGPWTEALAGAHALINLVGESISLPWTAENRRKILASRVDSCHVLGRALAGLQSPPPVWVQSSATGFYGNRGDEVLTEESAAGNTSEFLVETCLAWEGAAREACPSTVELRLVRTGLVLGDGGGALPPILKVARMYLGGSLGSGQQYMSWIHELDLVRQYVWLCDHCERPAIVNGTAPNPARNVDFMATLRRVIGRPWAPPAPALAMKLMAKLGGPASELVLDSCRAIPQAAQRADFEFKFSDLESALRDLVPK
ncbi:MAG: TIGR01777 family oxidoreductase [Chthonomonas sp.]|nr:TIGR01777 family oxidoreductase [Chthonomonas sp.]